MAVLVLYRGAWCPQGNIALPTERAELVPALTNCDAAPITGMTTVEEPKEISMTVKLGLLALLEAKPGQGAALGAFLEAGRALALAEPGTVTWYAFKISDTEYGIFDSFETEEARQAHLGGEIPTALGQVAPELLAKAPDIRMVDLVAVK